MEPHKHCELIKAWADGAEIEYYNNNIGGWKKLDTPTWMATEEYRIKPKDPKTILVFEWMYKLADEWFLSSRVLTEEKAKDHFELLKHKKTGRQWEVEV